jgi:hypothetical protein
MQAGHTCEGTCLLPPYPPKRSGFPWSSAFWKLLESILLQFGTCPTCHPYTLHFRNREEVLAGRHTYEIGMSTSVR